MGVYCDRYIGYMMDVTEEVLNLNSDNFFDKYLEGVGLNPELSKFNFVPKYSDTEPKKDNITLIYDGMNGNYSKLIYIIEVDRYSDNESDVNDTINNALKLTPVPQNIIEKIQSCYKLLFEKEPTNPIYLQDLAHFH